MVTDCMARESKLSDWERIFLDSISAQDDGLTPRQEDKLNEIWERVTS